MLLSLIIPKQLVCQLATTSNRTTCQTSKRCDRSTKKSGPMFYRTCSDVLTSLWLASSIESRKDKHLGTQGSMGKDATIVLPIQILQDGNLSQVRISMLSSSFQRSGLSMSRCIVL